MILRYVSWSSRPTQLLVWVGNSSARTGGRQSSSILELGMNVGSRGEARASTRGRMRLF